MEQGYPKELGYLVLNPDQKETHQTLYRKHIKELTESYMKNFYSEGVRDQSQFEQDIMDLATKYATEELERIGHTKYSIERIMVRDKEDEKITRRMIENRKDFNRWVGASIIHPIGEPRPEPSEVMIDCPGCHNMISKSVYTSHINACHIFYAWKHSIVQSYKKFKEEWLKCGKD